MKKRIAVSVTIALLVMLNASLLFSLERARKTISYQAEGITANERSIRALADATVLTAQFGYLSAQAGHDWPSVSNHVFASYSANFH